MSVWAVDDHLQTGSPGSEVSPCLITPGLVSGRQPLAFSERTHKHLCVLHRRTSPNNPFTAPPTSTLHPWMNRRQSRKGPRLLDMKSEWGADVAMPVLRLCNLHRVYKQPLRCCGLMFSYAQPVCLGRLLCVCVFIAFVHVK